MNQKKNRGFTLIELLAVIVILAIIALIAVPIIMNIINKANKSAFKDTAYGVISAGELYFAERQLEPNGMLEDVTFNLPETTKTLQLNGEVPTGQILITKEGKVAIAVHNNRYCVTKGIEDKDIIVTEDVANCVLPVSITNITLKEENIVLNKGEEKQIEIIFEPSDSTNKTLNYVSSNTSVLTVDLNGKIKAVEKGTAKVTITTTDGSDISKEIQVIVNAPIFTSDNSCIQKGNVCSDADILAGIKVNVKVNNSETYDFYVISNTDSEITLMMNRNIYAEGNTTEPDVAWYADSHTNSQGPKTAVAALKERTSTWSNIPERTYTYSDDGGGNMYSSFTEIMRARMLTYTEFIDIWKANNNTMPSWMYINLYNTGDNNTNGYWLTAANSPSSNTAIYISNYGRATGNGVRSVSYCGIRPVITLTK